MEQNAVYKHQALLNQQLIDVSRRNQNVNLLVYL